MLSRTTDLWDHVPPHNSSYSPYDYDCAKIKSGYDFCYSDCNLCTKRRSNGWVQPFQSGASLSGEND